MKISPADAKQRLKRLPGWQLEGGVLVKEFEFKDFKQAFRFMSLCARAAEEMQHHPEWSNTYNKVSVRLTTHDERGLSELDFELARRMNALRVKI